MLARRAALRSRALRTLDVAAHGELVPYPSVPDALDGVRRGELTAAVVPLEWWSLGVLILTSITVGQFLRLRSNLVEVAITESERFYPAFQYVVWAGKSPADALTASILETVGEA